MALPPLRVCRESPGRLVLELPSDDAGLEAGAVDVLLRALVSVARLTFPVEVLAPPLAATWEARGEDHARELPLGAGVAWTRHLAITLGFAEMRGLLSTRRAKRARALFDDGTFAWSHGSQVVVLTAPDAPLPELDAGTLEALFGEAWRDVHVAGALGVMRPSERGDACFSLAGAAVEASVLAALAREADTAGRALEIPQPWI